VDHDPRFQRLLDALRVVAPALQDAGIPFVLGGSMACWVHGAPPPTNDIDLAIRPADVDRALETLVAAGLRAERPAERWLVKAHHDDALVDLIFEPLGLEVTDDLLAAAQVRDVAGLRLGIMALEDVFTSKLLALDEHHLDFEYLLAIARPVRERVRWDEVRERTRHSPYAAGFLSLLERLDVAPPGTADGVRGGARG
jgi:predicted nucleotidyltransferase